MSVVIPIQNPNKSLEFIGKAKNPSNSCTLSLKEGAAGKSSFRANLIESSSGGALGGGPRSTFWRPPKSAQGDGRAEVCAPTFLLAILRLGVFPPGR